MLSYTINKLNESGFTITYDFNVNLRPISFSFVYNCMCPFSFKQINQFTDKSITSFYFTDNIYYTNDGDHLTLTYYMYDIVYNPSDSAYIMNILKQSCNDIIMNKTIIACSIIKNKQYINAIENGNLNYLIDNITQLHLININDKSPLYYAIYYKQYEIIEWLLNNKIAIEFIDLEYSDEIIQNMLVNSFQCPSHIKLFLEKNNDKTDFHSRKRKNENENDEFHSKIKCI